MSAMSGVSTCKLKEEFIKFIPPSRKNILALIFLLAISIAFYNLCLSGSLVVRFPLCVIRKPDGHLPHPRYIQRIPVPRFESKTDYAINTRRLVLLATHRMNQIVQEMTRDLDSSSVSCSKWWANPLQVLKNSIVESTTIYDIHELEFVTNSKWENATFRTTARVYVHNLPESVEFLNDEFNRMVTTNSSSLPVSCFPDQDTSAAWIQLCSCDRGNGEQTISPDLLFPRAWPVNSSFMVGDYLNFNEPRGLFNLLPSGKMVCGSSNMLVVIVSAPTHFDQRYMIRKTFGSKPELERRNTSLVFLVGRVHDHDVEHMLKEEASIYHDIIQANVMDAYGNLTLKHMSMLAYVYFSCSRPSKHCGDRLAFDRSYYNPPPYLLKADDDFFLNLDIALLLAAANLNVQLMGSLNCHAWPFRQLNSKYYVPSYVYSAKMYPGFLLGGTILMRSDVIPKFLEASLTVPMLNLGDPYVTGLLAHAIGVQPRNSSTFGTHFTIKEKERPFRYLQLHTMIHSHMDSVNELRGTYDLWSSSPPSLPTKTNKTVPTISGDHLKVGPYKC